MIRVIFATFIACGNVDAASLNVEMTCDQSSLVWNQSTQLLTCGNLKMMPKCNASYDSVTRTLTCSAVGNIDFYCPGGFKQTISEGPVARYYCSDIDLPRPGNLRITISK